MATVPMSGRARHTQYFDADGTWIRGYWRVINGTPYKFSKAVTVDGDTLLMAMSLVGPYSHFIVHTKEESIKDG